MKTTIHFLLRFLERFTAKLLLGNLLCFGWSAIAWGQTIPRPAGGGNTPLHPMAGKVYTYAVTIPAPYTSPQSFDWYVTDNPAFVKDSIPVTTGILTNNKEYIDAGAGYHNPVAGTSSITIKWTGKAVAAAKIKPYFLVISYNGTNGTFCDAMNLKAYKVIPFSAFTLDLTNVKGTTDLGLDGLNTAVSSNLCAGDIASASFDGTKMVYDYGTNELIFKVVAANFTVGWKPSVKISGLAGGQTIGSVEWSETTTFTGTNAMSKTGDEWTSTGNIPAPANDQTESGVTTYIRVTIKNNAFEGSSDTPVTLAINGVTNDGEEDVHYADGLPDGFTNDASTQVILARPVITSNTGSPAQGFLP